MAEPKNRIYESSVSAQGLHIEKQAPKAERQPPVNTRSNQMPQVGEVRDEVVINRLINFFKDF